MRFKVLRGTHCENGKRYRVGDIVETDQNLEELPSGRSRFMYLHENTKEVKQERVKTEQKNLKTDKPFVPVQRETSSNWYDVFDTRTGDIVSTRALRKGAALVFAEEKIREEYEQEQAQKALYGDASVEAEEAASTEEHQES